MQNEQATNLAPDWITTQQDLHCPLCEYNLRGLTESRCPECGFAFTWAELLDALKNKHPYLFEYGRGKNIKTFCKTWWRTSQPRRFWREVNPAQDVKVVRLILYWVIAYSLVLLGICVPYVKPAYTFAVETFDYRATFKPLPGQPRIIQSTASGPLFSVAGPIMANQLDDHVPPPWRLDFWRLLLQKIEFQSPESSNIARDAAILSGAIYLLWPWLTLIALLIFRSSMRQTKVKITQVLRTTIYSCESTLLFAIAVSGIYWIDLQYNSGALSMLVTGVCAVAATYRLTVAFKRYLRVHLPFATVLASQLIAGLIVFILLVQIADFTRRI